MEFLKKKKNKHSLPRWKVARARRLRRDRALAVPSLSLAASMASLASSPESGGVHDVIHREADSDDESQGSLESVDHLVSSRHLFRATSASIQLVADTTYHVS